MTSMLNGCKRGKVSSSLDILVHDFVRGLWPQIFYGEQLMAWSPTSNLYHILRSRLTTSSEQQG
jgi:hypothetical protein